MSSYEEIYYQHSMFFDELRNSYYLEAIQKAVNCESIVLDLGAGLGVFGLMALEAGAKKVYFIDPASIIDTTKMVIKESNFSDRAICIEGKIEEIDLPEKVDVIISVFTGNFLLSEDLLPSLFYARDKYLRKGGSLIPDCATMVTVPVSFPKFYKKYIDCWSGNIHNANFSVVRQFAVNSIYRVSPREKEITFLSKPVEILELDFMESTEAACRQTIKVKIQQKGIMDGWLGWFTAKLGDRWLSTSPLDVQMHWSQIFLPVAEPINVIEDTNVNLFLSRPEFSDWSWVVEHNGKRQKHSTFLSEPRKMKDLFKLSEDYKGKLSEKGMITQEALSLVDGHSTTDDIAQHLFKKFPHFFKNERHTELFVGKLFAQFT